MKHPLRIAMIAYAHYFTDARIKNYVDALLDSGASVEVFALGRDVERKQVGRLTVHSLATKYQGSSSIRYVVEQLLFLMKAVWHLLLRTFHGKYDVVHVHNMPDFLTLAALPFKVVGTKIILDVHDTMPEAYATKFGYELDSVPIKILIREELISAACADKVITTNRMHKEVLAGHGIPENKIYLIYNVGNTKIFKPKPAVHHGQELWLGYHGTIARRLGVDLIIDSLSLVKDECTGLRFLCVGEGDDLPAMKKHAAEKRVGDMIEWEPFVEVERLPEVLGRVGVGIIGNRRDTERKRNFMLPVKMLEYAAMEIPTIVPRLQILERYFDESSAFFYEPDDAEALAKVLRTIYNNREVIATRTEGLRKFNTRYNWDIMALRYLNIVHGLVKR